jgi:hypothetical protein
LRKGAVFELTEGRRTIADVEILKDGDGAAKGDAPADG